MAALAAPTYALARPPTLERLIALQACARLRDVDTVRYRVQVVDVVDHPLRILRVGKTANETDRHTMPTTATPMGTFGDMIVTEIEYATEDHSKRNRDEDHIGGVGVYFVRSCRSSRICSEDLRSVRPPGILHSG